MHRIVINKKMEIKADVYLTDLPVPCQIRFNRRIFAVYCWISSDITCLRWYIEFTQIFFLMRFALYTTFILRVDYCSLKISSLSIK